MTAGIAQDKQTRRKVLYRTDDVHPDGTVMWALGVCIWIPDSNEIRPLALREFHDRYVVERRFEAQHMPRQIL